mgnify:CR=1 FL=1
MKKYLIGTSLIFGSLVAGPILAEENFYLSIGAGKAFPSDAESSYTVGSTVYDITEETDDPGILSIGFGKKFNNDFRVEFNLSKSTVSTDSFTVTSGGSGVTGSITPALEYDVTTYMIYGLKDFPNDSKFTPYGGIGIGFASLDADDQIATIAGTAYSFTFEEESVLSYALKGGISYEIAENSSLFTELGYQHLNSYDSAGNVNYDSNSLVGLSAGIRFSF